MITTFSSNYEEKLKKVICYLLLVVAFLVPLLPEIGTAFVPLALLVALYKMIRYRRLDITRGPCDWLVLGYGAFSLLSIINSPVKDFSAFFWTYNVAVPLCVYYLTLSYVDTYEMRKKLLLVIIASALCTCIYGLYQYSHMYGIGSGEWVDSSKFPLIKRRLFSTLQNPNLMGAYLLEVLAIASPLSILHKRLKRPWQAWLIILFFLVCVTLTYSRGIWVSLVVMVLYWGLVLERRLLLSLLAIPFVLFFYHGGVARRLWSLFQSHDTSVSLRYALWDSSTYMIQDHPWIGVGWGAYWAVYPQYNYFIQDPQTVIYHAHNMFIHLAAVIGLPGMACFVGLMLVHAWKAYRLDTQDRTAELVIKYGITALVLGVMVSGITDFELYSHQVTMIFWQILALGATVIVGNEKEKVASN